MKIVHFSDWHAKLVDFKGRPRKLPEADLYVCTGDIIDNTEPPPWGICWPNALTEVPFQQRWIAEARREWSGIFPNRAPLLIVKGNHDFTDLRDLFDDGSREIYEFKDEPSVWELNATSRSGQRLRFGGFRGVPTINGCWADECTERVLGIKCDVLEGLGAIDVLVTHAPAYGMLDLARAGRLGSRSQMTYLLGVKKPIAHLFGHIHESAGTFEKHGVRLSNAACGVNVLNFK